MKRLDAVEARRRANSVAVTAAVTADVTDFLSNVESNTATQIRNGIKMADTASSLVG